MLPLCGQQQWMAGADVPSDVLTHLFHAVEEKDTIADTAVTTQITDYTKKHQQEEISDAENRHQSVLLATADDGSASCCCWLELIGLYFI